MQGSSSEMASDRGPVSLGLLAAPSEPGEVMLIQSCCWLVHLIRLLPRRMAPAIASTFQRHRVPGHGNLLNIPCWPVVCDCDPRLSCDSSPVCQLLCTLLLHRGANGVSGHLIIASPRHIDSRPRLAYSVPLSTVKYFTVVVWSCHVCRYHR